MAVLDTQTSVREFLEVYRERIGPFLEKRNLTGLRGTISGFSEEARFLGIENPKYLLILKHLSDLSGVRIKGPSTEEIDYVRDYVSGKVRELEQEGFFS